MLTLFGSVAVLIMFLSCWMESRSKWFVLVFARGPAAIFLYNALAQAYPVTVVEVLWALVALQRLLRKASSGSTWLIRAPEPHLFPRLF